MLTVVGVILFVISRIGLYYNSKKKVTPAVSKYLAMEKIKKVILSCTETSQIKVCNAMVSQFRDTYKDYDLYEYLWSLKSTQRRKIIQTRINKHKKK